MAQARLELLTLWPPLLEGWSCRHASQPSFGYLYLSTPGSLSAPFPPYRKPLAPGLCVLNYEEPAGFIPQSARLGKYHRIPLLYVGRRGLAWAC